MQREREETKESILSEGKILQSQIDSVATDLLDVLKKERADRERAVEGIKRRAEDEKKELHETIDRDRSCNLLYMGQITVFQRNFLESNFFFSFFSPRTLS